MDKYDTSQITEFPRFEAESTQSGVTTFLNKIWKLPLFSGAESSESLQNKALTEGKGASQPPLDHEKQEIEEKPETGSYAVEFEDRSLPNVLKRISSLVALGSKGGTRYADTELARYWMPDDISRECYECAARFSTLRRRHHCRVCGQIFCSRCCSQRVPGQIFGCAGGLRVCNYCCNVVLSYLRENDMSGDISPDLRTLQENLQVKFPENRSRSPHGRENFTFAREHEERSEARPREAIQDVFRHLACSLPTQQHRYRLVRYNGVWRGCDVLQWIMDNTNNKTRVQATQVCQALLGGYMECCSELPHFADYALYKPVAPPPPPPPPRAESPKDCCEQRPRLVESVSSYCLDLNLGENSARLIKTAKADNKTSSPSSEEENPLLDQSEGSATAETKAVCRAIEESGEDHLRLLARQCLAREGLAPAWLQVLFPLCRQAAEIVVPELFSNDIDARNYVQVKKAPGGSPAESRVIHGVALTKNVAHRGMPQELTNPTVLLLDCSIAYQRVEGKLTSLEPVLLQEREYLVRCAARIAALQPKVVLVRGSAARGVQDALRARGVALATGVGAPGLARAARCTGADVVTSIDARIGAPRLGMCRNFYVRNYGDKTLLVLEGCAAPQLGCCLLLRGGTRPELARLKKVAKFMILACYNWKHEKSFLSDIEAVLPEPGVTFGDGNTDAGDNETAENDGTASCSETPVKSEGDKAEMRSAEATKSTGDKSEISATETACGSETPFKSEGDKAGISSDGSSIEAMKSSGEKCQPVCSSETPLKLEGDNTGIRSERNSIESTEINAADSKNESTSKSENDKTQTAINPNTESVSKPNSAVEDRDNSQIDPTIPNTESASKSTESEQDPLQKAKPYARKTDSERNLSCVVPIRDFSDPLRATRNSMEDEVFLPREETKLKADSQNDRWSTDDAVLSISPNVLIPAPYLETEAGRRCALRRYFPAPLLPPRRRPAPPTPRARRPPAQQQARPSQRQELHPFARDPITESADNPELRASLAHYRAHGSWIDHADHKEDCPLHEPCVVKKQPVAQSPAPRSPPERVSDPLAPENHQRLTLLMYSFSDKSANFPNFCVDPWISTMEMYGRRDIALGAFLEKYCFNGEHKCPSSPTCQVPMNQHVRRFVHDDVCITITCNTIGHSSVDLSNEDQSKQIMFWSRCPLCAVSTRASRLARASLALSLCAYLSLRARAPRYLRAAACAHPAHAHAHYFASRLTTACFKYNKISTWEIELPPAVISINYDTRAMRDALIHQLNELMLKGHEAFSAISDGDADKDQLNFKQHMEHIHLALTSDALQEYTSAAGVVRSLWNVSDRITVGEKMLRDAQEKWSSPVKAGKAHPDVADEKSDLDDSGTDSANDNADARDESDRGADEDEEKGDKKTVRQILSQLLSNNQPSNQSGMIISSGLLPVAVVAGEIGSVIAATLASVTYQRTLAGLYSTQSEDEAEVSGSGKEKSDADKAKPKPSDHIEVLLKDGLLCRVYYAAQFHRLRHLLLCPLSGNPHIVDEFARAGPSEAEAGPSEADPSEAEPERCCLEDAKEKVDNKTLCEVEEGFLRSLSHCVPWAARGGKSGSTFGKTSDDRYVLKEMTKPEWQQFLDFAPDYFSYVINCHQKKLPSLLARILGVYSVGGAGNGVLVMENILYARPGLTRCFDLKGSSRHRLAPGEQAVLMDENLLQMRWETQLYVASHTARVLFAGVERDTGFLAAKCVMDYSLLLGLDRGRLLVGIIDYIRTFTWDKKLEHYVKKNLGSGQPTILSPQQYRLRFSAAMHKYFLHCPAHWDHLMEPSAPHP